MTAPVLYSVYLYGSRARNVRFRGTFAGLGFAFFSGYTSQGFSNPEQVKRRFGGPLLTSIMLTER